MVKFIAVSIIPFSIFIAVFSCLLLFEGPAIYKSNAIYISLIYFIAIGIKRTIKNIKNLIYIILTLYILLFIVFQTYYFGIYGRINQNRSFNNDVMEITQYLEKYEDKKIYFRTYAIQPYIYTLLGNKLSPSEFMSNLDRQVGSIIAYDKYMFRLPKEITDDTIFVIKIPECNDENLFEELRNKEFKEEIYKGEYIIFYK